MRMNSLGQKKVIGIDVGIAITGWSIIERDSSVQNRNRLIDYGAIITNKKQLNAVRLLEIYNALTDVIKQYKPNCFAIESLFFFKNKKTIITVGQARGVMLLVAAQNDLPVFEYTPLQVKSAVTGYGKAEKDQVQKMVKLIYKLDEIPKPDDVADAIAVGTCHMNTF